MHFINGNDCFVGYGNPCAMAIPVLWDFAMIIFDALRGTEGSIVLYVSL